MSTTINLNFQPVNSNGEPHLYKTTAALWLAEQLKSRVSTDNPLLELQVANQLEATGEIILSDVDKAYFINVITKLQVDTLWKGQILAKF